MKCSETVNFLKFGSDDQKSLLSVVFPSVMAGNFCQQEGVI